MIQHITSQIHRLHSVFLDRDRDNGVIKFMAEGAHSVGPFLVVVEGAHNQRQSRVQDAAILMWPTMQWSDDECIQIPAPSSPLQFKVGPSISPDWLLSWIYTTDRYLNYCSDSLGKVHFFSFQIASRFSWTHALRHFRLMNGATGAPPFFRRRLGWLILTLSSSMAQPIILIATAYNNHTSLLFKIFNKWNTRKRKSKKKQTNISKQSNCYTFVALE